MTDPSRTESALQSLTQALEQLQQTVLDSLNQEIAQLQAEKNRLAAEVRRLQGEQQQLQTHYLRSLFDQQLAQQQQLTQQFMQELSIQLRSHLTQQSSPLQMPLDPVGEPSTSERVASLYLEQVQQLLADFSTSFSVTCQSLQRELQEHQSGLSRQLSRMQNLEQQGEALLATLVVRLNKQLQITTSQFQNPRTSGSGTRPGLQEDPDRTQTAPAWQHSRRFLVTGRRDASASGGPPPTRLRPQPRARLLLGLLLVFLASGALAFSYLGFKVMLSPDPTFGPFAQAEVSASNPGHLLWLIWLRLMVILPLMVLAARVLEPTSWQMLRQSVIAPPPRLWVGVLGSGCLLFLAQALLIWAIAWVPTGAAVSLFFLYPLVIVPLTWHLRRERPTPLGGLVLAGIALGGVLVFPLTANLTSVAWLGSTAALGSGLAFAGSLYFSQVYGRQMHPIPLGLLYFAATFAVATLALLLPWAWIGPVNSGAAEWPDLFLGGCLLGVIAGGAYVLNLRGTGLIGPGRAAVIGASSPAITTALAALLLQESLREWQVVGVILVTLCGVILFLERLHLTRSIAPLPPSP